MKTITVTQGSVEWAALRAQHNTASEAPAMMGASKYQSRDELLRQKATGIVAEVSRHQQAIFDKGHAAEAAARTLLEVQTGEDFYPITAVSDDGTLLASVDGITMDDSTLFEHKLFNEKLAHGVELGDLDPHYIWQLEQQLLVTGAKKVVFVCSDGTKDNWAQMDYYPVPGRAERLKAGWAQFDIDKAAYVPVAVMAVPVAAPVQSLPGLFIQAKGEIVTSNMREWGNALAARLLELRSLVWVTDQDFADAKSSAKMLRGTIEMVKVAKTAMLAQTASVGEAAQLMDAWCEDMRKTALQIEKDAEREDLNKKTIMILAAKVAYAEHVSTLSLEIAPHRIFVDTPVFADAIKGKRNFVSMQDGLNTMLANAKIVANEDAALVRCNLAYFAEHQASELAKEEATRARIRAEEVAKLEREQAEAKRRQEETELAAATLEGLAVARQEEDLPVTLIDALEGVATALVADMAVSRVIESSKPVANIVPMRANQPAPAAMTPPTLKLGQISERLGFNLTGEFLKNLGFEPAARANNAVLFHESDFPLMCMRLVSHIQGVQRQQAA